MASAPQLEIQGLSKRFAGPGGEEPVEVLAGIDLRVEPGEFVSIIGPSGCGKSTLFNILSGLDPASSGQIRFKGESDPELLGNVGYMPQQDLLMPWRTVLDNTILGLEMAGVVREQARERARAEFGRFGLAGFEQAWPSQISAGMRQRAALLRTFLTGASLILLDEPFAALDALTRQEMQRWLLEIWEERGSTILFVTHDIEEALFLSDRVHVMSARPGRIRLSVEVPMPRPRDYERTTLDPAFVELKGQLHRALRPGEEGAEENGPQADGPGEDAA